jgi:MYXO-CTERM domain-containing protein
MADIEATFNGGLAECAGAENDWYYGLDAKGGDRTDLVSVVLHELAHGLGFNSLVDPDTGAAPQGLMDVFSTHVFDVTRGRSWADLTATERAASAGNVRRLVWSGENVTRMAPAVLAKGSPLVGFAPVPPPGLRGFVSEAEFGARASARPARGRLVAISPAAGCSISADLSGAVALFVAPFCPPIQEAARAEAAGAIGALVTDGRDVVPPFSMGAPLAHRSAFPVTIPVLGIADRDAALLAGVRDLTAEIGSEADRLVGADEGGRVYLFASDPVFPASSVSHWDTLARPSLLEEPESTTDVSHDLRLEQALLRDIGWTSLCGNGALDAGEECDSGSDNSDFTPGSCRSTCRRAHCGDRVIDAEETCDEGVENGWPATTCSATCTPQTSGGPGGGGGGGAGGGGGGGGDGCGPCGVGGGWTSAGSWPWLAVLALYERHRRRRRRDRQRAGSST